VSSEFSNWFAQLCGADAAPHEWQRELAGAQACRSRLIRVGTGMGKTLGALAAWSWHRIARADDAWPRRLVWCLPMRVLVEQTDAVVRGAFERLGLLWDGESEHAGKVGVHLLMGGASDDVAWTIHPDAPAVLIGTQDMLLSRALNRGYASYAARWPLELAYVSHDALWVMDEIQLMDVGLATATHLQAFHDEDAARGFRPRHTWWMSATLQPAWLRTVDTAARHAAWVADPVTLSPAALARGLGAIRKTVTSATIPATDPAALAEFVARQHAELLEGEFGRVTLVVCNTVARARATRDALAKLATGAELQLVHSRFRPAERAAWRAAFLSREACRIGANRIIIATQVVEAGVDLSAGCLVTELAPWPSLVQRFGRCARYGGEGRIVVVDRGRDEKHAAPYRPEQLDASWRAASSLVDVGLAALEAFEAALSNAERAALYPFEPSQLLLRQDLEELFDTTPDLTGAQLDIGRFIRDGVDRDVQVFWRDLEAKATPDHRVRARRNELCSVPFLDARNWLCGEETKSNRKPKLLARMRAWLWDWIDGEWKPVARPAIVPGVILCVAADCGGYDSERGFTAEAGTVPVVPESALPDDAARAEDADDAEDAEDLSMYDWKTIACHGSEAADEARRIGEAVALPPRVGELLALAALWHDVGKGHPAFQGAIASGAGTAGRPPRQDFAKAPAVAWRRGRNMYTAPGGDVRRGFRHELASMLSLFAVLERHAPDHPALLGPWRDALALAPLASRERAASDAPTPLEQQILACDAGEFDLLAYLVLCHHGKVRVALHASPKDQTYHLRDGRGLPIRGVREGDVLPALVLAADQPSVPALSLTLAPAGLGLSGRTGRSWRERTLDLQARFGTGALAWLESLIIAADRRASRRRTPDPMLAGGGAAP
jgi:CRISPR-associated endonuclease/helicase Cas3